MQKNLAQNRIITNFAAKTCINIPLFKEERVFNDNED